LEIETLEKLSASSVDDPCVETLDPAHVSQVLRSGELGPGGQPLRYVTDAVG
jgi:hypothetical protein